MGRLGILAQEPVVQLCLRALAGGHRVLKLLKASQIVPPALEADARPPQMLGRQPVHSGDAAAVVPAHRLVLQHLHAGPVHIGQRLEPKLPPAAVTAGDLTTAQAIGLDGDLLTAAAPAQPGGPASVVLRGPEHGQTSELLARQIKTLSAVAAPGEQGFLRHVQTHPFRCQRSARPFQAARRNSLTAQWVAKIYTILQA